MTNQDFFSGSSIVPAKTAPAPYPASPLNTAILFAAADKNTKLQLTKEAFSDQCRALLAYSAMENVLLLSVLEAHCSQTAPLGQQRYKAIADAYTAGAAAKIVRWE